jgi:outer membrane protein assembly factor BamA
LERLIILPKWFREIYNHIQTGRRLSCAFILIFISVNGNAQDILNDSSNLFSSKNMLIRNIQITGAKKTKTYIILREIPFTTGDIISEKKLNASLQAARDYIYNTKLFLDVQVLQQPVNDSITDVKVVVKERWYFFPIPFAELADRSFNVWWETYHASLDRISYGVLLSQANLSGRNDHLTVLVVNGFKRNLSFEYTAPYTNPALTDGVKFGAGLLQTKEIPYQTSADNHLVYFRNDDFVKSEWYITAAYSSRKAWKKKETFSVSFRHVHVDDSLIMHYNPGYFNEINNSENFIELEYKLQFSELDNQSYPLKGYSRSIALKKTGLQFSGGINQFSIKPAWSRYFSYKHHWYTSFRLSAEIKLPFEQPYYNQKALGYGNNYLRGYEYFVIDGPLFLLSQFDLKHKILQIGLPGLPQSKNYQRIPFAFYAKVYGDAGYVYNKPEFTGILNNRLLYSGGLGIDIVTFYDLKLSIEYSLNHLGQKGLFLHR